MAAPLISVPHAQPELERGSAPGHVLNIVGREDVAEAVTLDPPSVEIKRRLSYESINTHLLWKVSPRLLLPSTTIGLSGSTTTLEDQLQSEKHNAGNKGEGLVGGRTLYVEFAEKDPRDPFSWSTGKKWTTILVACCYTGFVSSGSSTFTTGYPSMIRDLNCSNLAATAGLSTYTLGFALAPLVLSSLSEEFGRRAIYLTTSFGFFISFLPIALARSITTVIVFRLIQGAAASTGATMVGGTIADLFRTHERGLPMSSYSASAMIGAGLGPAIAGWMEGNPRLEWRWIQWISLICSGVQFILIYLFMPETRSTILLMRTAKKLREQTGNPNYLARVEDERPSLKTLIYVSCTRPIWLLVSEPIVLSFSIWIGFVWGVLYILIESIELVFKTLYPNMTPGELGLMFLPLVIGAILGFLSNFWQEAIYRRKVATRGPEARLYGACGGVFCITAGSFIYAWTVLPGKNIPFIAPSIGITLNILGMFHVYLAVFNYLADAYLIYASSALSGQSCLRNMLSAIFPLFARRMYDTLQFKWALTLLGCITVLLSVIPFVLLAWGPMIRAHSRFAKQVCLQHTRMG